MIVVTGATGNVGRPLVEALAKAGEQVTAVARGVGDRPWPSGVEHRTADLQDPDSFAAAVSGAEKLFLFAAGDAPKKLVDAATQAGVRRVVLLSSLAVGTRPAGYAQLVEYEATIRESGADWTMLRCGAFMTNTFQWTEGVRTQRKVFTPFADVALPMIDPADIAAVAAEVLHDTGSEFAGRTYVLTGSEALTPRQRTEIIAQAVGEPVEVVEQTEQEARAQLTGFIPPPILDATMGILGSPSAEERAVSPDVERILGRSATTFADWAVRNVAAFQ